MAERSLAEILLGPEIRATFTTSNVDQAIAIRAYGFDTSVWSAMSAVLEGAAKLQDFGKARAMLARMLKWLDENQVKRNDPTSGYPQAPGGISLLRGRNRRGRRPQAGSARVVRALARDPTRSRSR
jgi:hypothetical protein